jgi:L-threonylcarbamoyladenylate synthase
MRPVDAAAIERAARILERGGLVAFPTETVYGLGADADNETAVRSIFAAKGRPADHPLIVHVLDAGALDAWARDVPPAARKLAASFWPGPLTLVLKRSSRARDVVTGGQDTVGLRSPAHPWARALLEAFAGADRTRAIVAPSANSFGRISPTTAAHVRADLGEKPAGKVDLILDGGACPVGIESTIVDLSADAPRLLRPGAITRDELEAALGVPVPDAPADAPRASGRLESHYAPRTPLELVEPAALAARINALRGTKLAVLAPAHALLDRTRDVVARLIAPQQPQEYARRLYALLHELDAAGAERILVVRPPTGSAWEAVHDRLRRAQSGG